MKGTAPQKAARLFVNLALHPRYASRYVANNLLQHRSPLDLELPWFSYAAIDFLEDYLDPSLAVFEYGSGGSTLFFARRAASVVSVEDNPEWFNRVQKRLAEQQITNVNRLLEQHRVSGPILVVTTAAHISRVMQLCQAHGINAVPSVTPELRYDEGRTGWRRWWPSFAALRGSESALYEYLAQAYLTIT